MMRKLSTRGLIKACGVVQKAPVMVLSQNFTVSAVRMVAPPAVTAAETQAMIKAFGDEQKDVVNRVSLKWIEILSEF